MLPIEVTRHESTLEISGGALTVLNGDWFVFPIRATLGLRATGDDLESYQIRFGDSVSPRFPFGDDMKLHRLLPRG